MNGGFVPYLPALLWAAGVLFVGGQSNPPAPRTDLPLDKFAHFGMYGVLGVLTGYGWLRAGRRPARLWLFAALVAVGATDELHQLVVPGRSGEWGDWVADVAGGGVGLFAYTWFKQRSRNGHAS